jgi:hypothetical protein
MEENVMIKKKVFWSLMIIFMSLHGAFVSATDETSWDNLEIPGKVFYKTKENKLVFRMMTLVKEMDHKRVRLKSEKVDLVSDQIYTKEIHGKVVKNIVFKRVPHAPGKWMILTGTLIKGDNGGIYFGDIYLRAVKSMGEVENIFDDHGLLNNNSDNSSIEYIGGFSFKKVQTP